MSNIQEIQEAQAKLAENIEKSEEILDSSDEEEQESIVISSQDSIEEADSDDSEEDPTIEPADLKQEEEEEEEDEAVSDAQLKKELEEDTAIEQEEEKEIEQEAKEIDSRPDEDYIDGCDKFLVDNFDTIGILLEHLIEKLAEAEFCLPPKKQERKAASLKCALKSEDDYTDFGELVYAMLTHKVKAPTNSKSKQ